MAHQGHSGEDRAAKLFNRGNVLASKGQYRDALACYEKVLALAPTHVDTINNTANCLALLGRHQQAIASYDKLLEAKPDDLRARNNRANALKQVGRFPEAISDYERVLAVAPNYMDALYNRGNAYVDIGRPVEAIRDLRRAVELAPNDTVVHTSLIFALNFDTEATTQSLQAERARWAAAHQHLSAGVRHSNEAVPDRKLRIGYVSSHFRHQAATYSFGGVIVHHDPAQFEVVCYSDTSEEDDVTQRLRRRADKWCRTNGLSDREVADHIREDRIDILVDLVGHMKGHRLGVFALKPAPVQVTAWGEPSGSGLRAIDYLFADPIVIPQSERPLIAETVVDLPNFIGYWTPDQLPEPGPLPALARGYVTFGSFNRLAKIIDPVLRLWSAILRAVPNSRLLLKDRPLAPELQKANLLRVLADEGIAAERVVLLDQKGRWPHFLAYHEVDIALDPFPHGGGMTTLDALWMGVPVITTPGSTMYSRIATATLTAAGLPDFIAADHKHYVELAVTKSRDLEALARLRSALRGTIANTDFGDPVRYARAVEEQYRLMWRKWCEARLTA